MLRGVPFPYHCLGKDAVGLDGRRRDAVIRRHSFRRICSVFHCAGRSRVIANATDTPTQHQNSTQCRDALPRPNLPTSAAPGSAGILQGLF